MTGSWNKGAETMAGNQNEERGHHLRIVRAIVPPGGNAGREENNQREEETCGKSRERIDYSETEDVGAGGDRPDPSGAVNPPHAANSELGCRFMGPTLDRSPE